MRHDGHCQSRGSKHQRGRPASPRCVAACVPARLRQDKSSGGTMSAQAGPGFGRVFFHQVALFLPKRIFSSNCLFFFLRENIIFNYISLGFH